MNNRMNISFTAISFLLIFFTSIVLGQDLITFDNNGWSNDQVLSNNLTLSDYTFSSNSKIYTNYGYNFNINENSLYYVFQNSSIDKLTITTKDSSLANFISLAAYQVSETSIQNLIIEGWNGSSRLYSKSFSNINSWQTITLNYNEINKVIIRLSSSSNSELVDYNFDNFAFDKPIEVSDTTPPLLISASVINPTTIDLIFSESLEYNSASNILNYKINNGIIINSVSINSENTKVTLNTAQNIANQIYTIVVSGVKDTAGNSISSNNNSAEYYYVGDSTPPELSLASILDSVTVELLFSEKIDIVNAQIKSNYLISNGINVLNAQISTNQNKVTLHTSGHVSGQSYSVTAQNIIDLAGNKISTNNTAKYLYFTDIIDPSISDISVTNNKSITVKFSERLDPNTAANKNNYNISNNIRINSAQLLPDSSGILLKTSQHQSGVDYTLTVSDIQDRAGNLISPNPSLKNYKLPEKTGGKPRKNKAQSATSNNWYQDLSPNKAIDGIGITDPLSRWCSDKSLPDTIDFDLGNRYSLDSIRISFYQWESGGQYKYSIYASDDLNSWEPVVEAVWSDNLEWTEIIFDDIEKRFIKVVILESNQSAPASIWEIETYGVEKTAGLKTLNAVPLSYELSQNYPNPFNPTTSIQYKVDRTQFVSLKVYDILGNEMATLVDENKQAGMYEVKFDASNLASGIYFYKLLADGFVSTKKMILLK